MSKKKTVLVVLFSLIMLISFIGSVININDIIKTTRQDDITSIENDETSSEKSREIMDLSGQEDSESEEENATIQQKKDDSKKASDSKNDEEKKVSEGDVESVSVEFSGKEKESIELNIEGEKLINTIGFVLIFVISFAGIVYELTGASAVSGDALKVTSIGKINNIGKRSYQQDSVGADVYDDGVFGVVADGMGGLSGGDEVSSAIVVNMLQNAQNIGNAPFDEALINLSSKAVSEVNRKLGVSGYYKSGSTLVAVYVKGGRLHWLSIGDSRIYLYRNGALMQINREHTYENELLHNALNNEISFDRAKSDSQANKLTSFIGMGKIKHSDFSVRSIKLVKGDRLLLMSDGIFGTLSEEEMTAIMQANNDCDIAAKKIEAAVNGKQKRGQDNFTTLIIGF